MKEIWKDIPNYENLYQVSNFGNVKSLNRKGKDGRLIKCRLLKLISDNSGYLMVGLSDGRSKMFRVHQLVAITFLEHEPNGHKVIVDHIDNNKLNNNISNLKVITQRENTSKDKNKGYTGVSWHRLNNKFQAHIRVDGKLKHLGYFKTPLQASKAYQLELKNI